jgi:hypothetical protein
MSLVRIVLLITASCLGGALSDALTAQQPATQLGSVTGRVLHAATRRGIPGAVLSIVGTDRRTAADSTGEFRLDNVPTGVYSLHVRAIGYAPFVRSDIPVGSGKPYDVMILLSPIPVQLEGVEIRASYFGQPADVAIGGQTLNAEDTRRTPGVQEDVVRAVALLPGVGVTTAGRNDLIVRGGAPFENLFLVDGIEVPNINHFGSQGSTGGPVSLINIDLVEQASFSAGGFRAKHGNRTASLTQITLRNGDRTRRSGEVNLSATGFGTILEGPLGASTSFLFSARRSYLDLLFKAAGFSFVPAYWDVQLKTTTRIDRNNTLSFLGIGAINTISFRNEDAEDRFDNSRILAPEQKQYITGVTWQRLLSDGVLTVTLGRTYTSFQTAQRDSLDPPQEIFRNSSTEGGNILRADVLFAASPRLELNIGGVANLASDLTYDVLLNGDQRRDAAGTPEPLRVDTSFTALHGAAYADGRYRIAAGVQISAGLRTSYFDFLGSILRLAPRLAVRVAAGPASVVTLGFGRYYQSPSYIWLIGDSENAARLRPFYADHVVLGFEHLPRPDLKLHAETYIKRYRDYPARLFRPQAVLSPTGFEDVTTDIPFGLEPLVSLGTGTAYGIDLLLQKRLSTIPLYGLLSASLARAEFEALDGQSRPGTFDTRFIGNAVVRYRVSAAWEVSGKFRVATGRPFTPFGATGPDAGRLDFSRYNGERLPAFHALDVRIDRRWSFRGLQLEVYLDVQNVYDRENISEFFWNARTQTPEAEGSLGVLPSIGVNLEF